MLEAFGLDPDVLHLNHGAFGVAPVTVRQAAAAWRERAERNPHRFNRTEVSGLVAAARERAAAFLGIEAARAAWVRNVSEGVSAVLGSLSLRPGDELVTSTHGYGAVRKALRHHAGRAGARVVEAAFPVGAGDDAVTAAYAGRLLGPHPAGRGRPDHLADRVRAARRGGGRRGQERQRRGPGAGRRRARARAAARRHRRPRRRPLGRQPAQVGVHARAAARCCGARRAPT